MSMLITLGFSNMSRPTYTDVTNQAAGANVRWFLIL